jgi:parallel beta-helix repeat protein
MSNKKVATLGFTVALALAGVVALLWLPALPVPSGVEGSKVEGLGGSRVVLAQAGTGIIRVATTGSDTSGCGGATPCQTVQYAVDQAQAGEEVRVASGLYTGVQGRPAPSEYLNPPASGVITQVVYISKTVTIRGGYTTAFTDPPDPETNPTTLDAQGEGRVLFITGDPSAGSGQAISPTIEGLHITNGDATGLGSVGGPDIGGGLYVINATVTISNNRMSSNTAQYGGGLFLHDSDVTLSRNTVTDNTASERGGGLYLWSSDATLSGNAVMSNTSDYSGGGLFLQFSDNAALSGNAVISNTAQVGGGLYLWGSDATLTNNVVADNQTTSSGGGLYIRASSPHLLHTTIARNSGTSGVSVSSWSGDYGTVALTNTILVSHSYDVGIYVTAGNTATLESTLWYGNAADWDGAGTIVTGTHNYWGAPLFDADGYHLLEGSAAIDKGVDTDVDTDIDGDSRDSTPDLGADERAGADVYLPIIMKNASP